MYERSMIRESKMYAKLLGYINQSHLLYQKLLNPLMDLRNSKWRKMEINTVLSGAEFGKFNQKPRAQTCADATQYVNIQYERTTALSLLKLRDRMAEAEVRQSRISHFSGILSAGMHISCNSKEQGSILRLKLK